MKAIILTAGFGNRMRPLTNDNHKTLLKIGEETILEKIINGLVDNNIKDVVIVTGYLRDRIRTFVENKYPKLNLTFVDNPIYDKTNNIYSMALAFENIEIDDDIMLIESDLIYHSKIIKQLIDDPRDNVALVDKYGSGMDGTVVKINNGTITQVIPPHLQEENFDFSDKYKTLNIYKFKKEFAASEFKKLLTYYARVIDDNCYYELILGILIYMQREKIHALVISGDDWAEVDDPNDLNTALFVFEKDKQLDLLNDAFGGYWQYDVVDFCFIRNMYFPNGSVLSELKNNLNELLWNYGSKQKFLDQKLSYYLLCNQANAVALNGAAQIYPILRLMLQGKKALIPDPTFGEYYQIFDTYNTYSDLGTDMLSFDELAQSDAEVIVFVNPNNPTGSQYDSDKIFNLAKKNKDKLIIIDESFIEFSKYKTLLPKLENDPLDNIIIIKSLSKSLGLPGVRLGYVFSTNRDYINHIRKNIPIWNMNSVAENFLEIIIKHRNDIQRSFERTVRDRNEFMTGLDGLAIVHKVLDSGGNFITCELNIKDDKLVCLQKTLLDKHKIYIKNVSSKFNQENAYLRLAVRTRSENLNLIKLLGSM